MLYENLETVPEVDTVLAKKSQLLAATENKHLQRLTWERIDKLLELRFAMTSAALANVELEQLELQNA